MSTVTLPPIGAKIRTTTRHDGGATVVIEGIVTAHPKANATDDSWVIVGDGEGVTAYVEDWPGAKVTVEVLELPEPPHGSVVLVTYAHGGFGAFHRDDCGRPEQANRWWGYSTREALTWGELLARGTVTPLVVDLASDAPKLPWEHEDERGDTFQVDVRSTEPTQLSVMVGDRLAWLPRDKAVEAARAILRWAGEQQ